MTQKLPGITFEPVHYALVRQVDQELLRYGDTFEALQVDVENLTYVSEHTTEDDNIYHYLQDSTQPGVAVIIWERFQ